MAVQPAARGRNPFDMHGVERGADGIARYQDRPRSLVHMLCASVQRGADALAIEEVGGQSLTYGELWERASRVAGGLRAAGLQRGDRAAIVLPNGADWVLAFWGAQLAGVVAVPVNTRFKASEVEYVISDSGAAHVFRPDEGLPDGEPEVVAGPRPRRPGRDLLHQRHDRLSQGGDDLPRQLPGQRRERGPLRGSRPGAGAIAGHAHQRATVSCHRV